MLSIPVNLLMLTGPFFMLQVYDRVLASGSIPTLVVLGGLTAGLYLFYGLLEGIRSRVLLRVGQQLDAHLSGPSFSRGINLPLLLGPRALKLDPVRDLETVRQFLSGPGPAALFDIPWMPFYLAIVYLFHPILGLLALSGAVVICLLIGLNEMFSRKPVNEASRHAGERAQLVQQGRSNGEVIASMGMMGSLLRTWQDGNASYLVAQRRSADLSGLFATLIKVFRFMLQSAVLGTGAWLAVLQEVSPGIMIAASIMTSRALAPVEQAVGQWRGFVGARQGFARLRKTLDHHGEEERLELPLPESRFAVQGLSAGPIGEDGAKPVIRNVSFELSGGDGLGIIGPSGCGKTTLARALVGVYRPLAGSVRLDKADLSQWDPDRRGSFIGYLPQDIQLFAGTVAQNIARFDAEADAEAVLAAAEHADAHNLIVALPDGYETIIGGDGTSANLSGGQMQRLALARALYKIPFLIVLDEPNSNLDAVGEAALTRAIKTMRSNGCIVIVIAHRPSALAGVDKLLYLQAGQVEAFGPRDEVLGKVTRPTSAPPPQGRSDV